MTIAEAQSLRYGAQAVKVYPDWIDINNRLPEIGQRFMTFSKIGNSRDIYAINDMTALMGIWTFKYSGVSHWMPLPNPPTSKV